MNTRGLIASIALACLALPFLNSRISTAHAQGTAFTYQGQLASGGAPANGSYDLAFTLFATNTTGVAIAGPVTNAAVAVTNGLFSTTVDFGDAYAGESNWLQIAVSTNGANVFTTLAPRQQLTPVPYAITAANVSGEISTAQLPSAVVTNGASGVSFSGTFNGSGSGLTNVPGTEPWQTVSGTNETATSNEGYLLTNNAADTVTLPTTANVGDIVTVSGTGSNGWLVTSGSQQSIEGYEAGVDWTPQSSSGSTYWQSVASSADGTHLVAAVFGGYLYTSTDSGVTWTPQTNSTSQNWCSVASSADGTHLVAAVFGGYLYRSTDSGVTWTNQNSPNLKWYSVASSADGTHLVAAVDGGYLYTSTNSGVTWTNQNSPIQSWYSVASSVDGTHLVAGAFSGYLYTSTNSGVTWTPQTTTNLSWVSVASSADGTHLVAVPYNGYIYTSTNSGVTWTQQTTNWQGWESVASSADGTHLVAAARNSYLYTSTDTGVTWTQQASTIQDWESVASSADGTHLVAAVYNGYLYTSSPASFAGPAGSMVQFQYQGNGVWQPMNNYASGSITASGSISASNNIVAGGSISANGGRLNNQPLYLRSGNDLNHGLAYNGSAVTNFGTGQYPVDGPALWGYSGGLLGVRNGGDTSVLQWTASGVTVNGTVTATAFSGNGSGLTGLSASALPSSVVTNNETGVTLSGTFSGNGSGLTGLSASALPSTVVTNNETGVTLSGTFSGNGGGLTGLSASALPSSVVTNNETNVTLTGAFSGSTLTFSNGPNLALNVQGSSSGGITSEIGLFQNNYTGSGESAPALRVIGYGSTLNGALSVSSQGTGLIAQFGNASAFVSSLDTNGTWTANSFIGNGSGLTNLTGVWSTNGNSLFYTNGNVGIGTNQPAAPLQVVGNVQLGSNGQYYATEGDENLRLLRGLIKVSSTNILAGSGFSLTKNGTGDYTITYTTAFNGFAFPNITVQSAANLLIPNVFTTTTGSFEVRFYNTSATLIDPDYFGFTVAGGR